MLVATRSFTAADGTEILSGISRISEDHPLAELYPDAFIPAHGGPPAGERSSALVRANDDLSFGNLSLAAREDRLPLDEELAVRAARLAELDSAARSRESRRYEREEEGRERAFWAETERLLHLPKAAPDSIHDLSALDAERDHAPLADYSSADHRINAVVEN